MPSPPARPRTRFAATLALGGVIAALFVTSLPPPQPPGPPPVAVPAGVLSPMAPVGAADAVRSITPPRAQFPALGTDRRAQEQYFAELREQVRWVPARMGKRELSTPDPVSRVLLAKSAAELAGLHEVGLNWRDVYGVINAETTWVPRTGMGKNGVPSYGLAQFEPATARAVGLRNPNDAVEAVHAAAVLLKEAAHWSAKKIEPLDLSPHQEAAKLREGVSVYYNLSTRSRKKWTGLNTAKLPVETRRHIANVRKGVYQAERLYVRLGGSGASSS